MKMQHSPLTKCPRLAALEQGTSCFNALNRSGHKGRPDYLTQSLIIRMHYVNTVTMLDNSSPCMKYVLKSQHVFWLHKLLNDENPLYIVCFPNSV